LPRKWLRATRRFLSDDGGRIEDALAIFHKILRLRIRPAGTRLKSRRKKPPA
jgi:hypothetical protein